MSIMRLDNILIKKSWNLCSESVQASLNVMSSKMIGMLINFLDPINGKMAFEL